jgi:N-acyl amino acid synthase of PEP-CTERM/exosortase system
MLFEKLLGNRDILIPYFQFNRALQGSSDSKLLEDIYALRYEVYCLECAFLEAQDFKEGLEIDEFDECSTHFAAYADDTSMVGTVRLVQPRDVQRYPFESHCDGFEGFVMPPREETAEVSRLVVRKTYRRRRGDSMQGVSQEFLEQGSSASITPRTSSVKQRADSPLLLLGLYREMYRYSRENGIRYWYAAMERSLARSLEKMGFKFVPIGPQVDYYGPVTPYMVDLNDLETCLERENSFLAAWFNDQPIQLSIRIKALVATGLRARATRHTRPTC